MQLDLLRENMGESDMMADRLKLQGNIMQNFSVTYFSKRYLFVQIGLFATAISVVAARYWLWSDTITFIGTVLCSIFVTFHAGTWLDMSWKIFHTTAVTSMIGLGISRAVTWPGLYAFLFFIGFSIVNKCSNYDRVTKIIGSFGVMLGGLSPLIDPKNSTTFHFVVSKWCAMLAFMTVPLLIVGFCILVPFPLLAFHEAQARISIVCVNLSTCLGAVTRAFNEADKVEMYRSLIQQQCQGIEESLDILSSLTNFVELEERYLSPVGLIPRKFMSALRNSNHIGSSGGINFSSFMRMFVSVSRSLLNELKALDQSLVKIRFNKTQMRFAQHMRDPMLDMARDMNSFLSLILEETNSFALLSFNTNVRSGVACGPLANANFQRSQAEWGQFLNQHRRDDHNNEATEENVLLGHGVDIEMGGGTTNSSPPTEASTGNHKGSTFSEARLYVIVSLESVATQLMDSYQAARSSIASNIQSNAHEPSNGEGVHVQNLLEEYKSEGLALSLLNIFPRGAYMHRLLSVKTELVRFHKVLEGQKPYDNASLANMAQNVVTFTWSVLIWWRGYLSACFAECFAIFQALASCVGLGLRCLLMFSDDFTKLANYWKTLSTLCFPFMQPCKIAGSLTLCTLFMTKLSHSSEMWANAFWAVAVIVFVRGDNLATSFTMSIQRVEGTVLGAVFSFLMIHLMGCNQESSRCSWMNKWIVITLWTGFCAAFRTSKAHAYAAIVAGFTPAFLLMGPVPGDYYGAFNRISMTVLGCFLYLAVDNVIAPVRIGDVVQGGVNMSVNKIGLLVDQLASGVGVIVESVSAVSASASQGNGDVENYSAKLRSSRFETVHNASSAQQQGEDENNGALHTEFDNIQHADALVKYGENMEESLKQGDVVMGTLMCLQEAMKFVAFEPELISTSFDADDYARLLKCLSHVAFNVATALKSIQAFHGVIIKELKQAPSQHGPLATLGTPFQQDLGVFGFMFLNASIMSPELEVQVATFLKETFITLQLICARSATAVKEANAIPSGVQLHARSFHSLLGIRQQSEDLFESINDRFRAVFQQTNGMHIKDPQFLIALQNVLESILTFVSCLSELGKSLDCIRIHNITQQQ